jgi:hypothetical protein
MEKSMISREAQETKEIADRLQMSPKFLSWMSLLPSPAISGWLKGEQPLKDGEYLLRLCQSIEAEVKEYGVPFSFRAASEQTAKRWRILILRTGRCAIRFKKSDADKLFGRRTLTSDGLQGAKPSPEPVAEPVAVREPETGVKA